RWIRGDWQIATWGLPFAPDSGDKLRRNYISSLSKWKIWDNIKRSLMPPALLLLLVLAWLTLPDILPWMIGFFVFWFFMPIVTSFVQLFQKPREVDRRSHVNDTFKTFLQTSGETLFNIACLPFEAYKNTNAIFLANWRMLFTKR